MSRIHDALRYFLMKAAEVLRSPFRQAESTAKQEQSTNHRHDDREIYVLEISEAETKRRRANDQRDERHQRKTIRFSWANFSVALFTLVAVGYYACIAHKQWGEMSRQTKIATDNMVASTRAWVGPTDASLDIKGERFQTILEFKNTGREPATKFDHKEDDWGATIEDTGPRNLFFSLRKQCKSDTGGEPCSARILKWRDECMKMGITGDRVAFPEALYKHTKDYLGGEPNRTPARAIFLQGCFTYRSVITGATEVHRSAFCYFYRFNKGARTERNRMTACQFGGYAD